MGKTDWLFFFRSNDYINGLKSFDFYELMLAKQHSRLNVHDFYRDAKFIREKKKKKEKNAQDNITVTMGTHLDKCRKHLQTLTLNIKLNNQRNSPLK